MELTAAIEALGALTRPMQVHLHTDSTYLRNGITEWVATWKANGWRTKARKPVANVDLWQALNALVTGHDITWLWVKAHDGDEGNERADTLARLGVEQVKPK
jgi:ribonuclease HI